MTLHRWTSIAGWLTVAGGAAWLAKIAVIVATDGRVMTTGAAAWLLRLGVVCLLAGATGGPLWLARARGRGVRVAAVLLSPVLLAGSLVALGAASTALLDGRGPAYLPAEIGIVVGATVWTAIGGALLRQVRRSARA